MATSFIAVSKVPTWDKAVACGDNFFRIELFAQTGSAILKPHNKAFARLKPEFLKPKIAVLKLAPSLQSRSRRRARNYTEKSKEKTMTKRFENEEKSGGRLQQFGNKPENLPLLFLVPLIQVAWAEGFVQPVERKAILKLAARLRITPRHPLFTDLLELLEERPPDEFFAQTNEILRETLEILPPAHSRNMRRILEIGCLRVAQAAPDVGVFRGRARVTPEERDEIFRLSEALNFASIDFAN